MAQKALTGIVDTRDEIIVELREEVDRLKRELKDSQEASLQVISGISNLRRQLSPLYSALQDVFGEMDKVRDNTEAQFTQYSGPMPGSGPVVDARVARVWEEWKKKLGGTAARVIDAMLIHGEMTVPQIRVAAQCGNQTVYDTTSKMNKLGLINKNGGKYSLKQL